MRSPFKPLPPVLTPLVYLRSRCSREQCEFGNNILDIKGADDASTASFTTDSERHCKIDLSARIGVVAWKDSDQQEHHTSELRIGLYLDTDERQALFTLHGHILLKDSNRKTDLILFVYPETIQSIGFARTRGPIPTTQEARDHDFIALHFIMTQPPSLVAPKGSPLEPKNRYQGVLDDMKFLGTTLQFTVYLDSLNLVFEAREQLALLPSVFSSTHPFGLIRTDEKRACLDTLFHSAPGQVINLGQTVVPTGTHSDRTLAEEADITRTEEIIGPVPPPYGQDVSPHLQSPLRMTPNGMSRHPNAVLSALKPSVFCRYKLPLHLDPSNT